MGIPHLITHLRPYAVAGDLTGKSVVIDGPAFAYHIFHLCLASKQDAKNPFEAIPSYALLGKTAIQWLDSLRLYNVKLKKVYFDGFLPHSKRATRGERLQSYTKQLSGYHEAWPQNIPSMLSPKMAAIPVDLFAPKAISPGLSKIPAAPFLVPTIIEALSRSVEYSGITEVVPGEADLYCARYLKRNGGCVFTSDSDLLVHDLGPDGSVSFLKDIMKVSTRGLISIRAVQYRLNAIAKRLNLSDDHGLRALAYEISLDAHATFPQLLQRSVKLEAVKSSKSMYADFCAQYLPLPPEEDTADCSAGSRASDSLKRLLKTLDPRISEYVLQLPMFARAAGLPLGKVSPSDQLQTGVEMFMPFLVDCPAKTSAWEMSTSERQLAYGLLNLAVLEDEKVLTVVENRRLQSTGGGREWALPTTEQMKEACRELLKAITTMRSHVPAISDDFFWYAMALQQDLAWCMDTGKRPLGVTLVNLHSGLATSRATWDIVHFAAQLHGAFYSFRMIRQILGLVRTHSPAEELPDDIAELYHELQSLPTLSELCSLDDVIAWLGSQDSIHAVEAARISLGVSRTEPDTLKLSKKKEKKKRKREATLDNSDASNRKPTNMFELLNNA